MTRQQAGRRGPQAALAAALMIPVLTMTGGAVTGGAVAAAVNRPVVRGSASSEPVLAWGHNFSGELGDGSTTDRHIPVKVRLPPGTQVRQIRAGCRHTLALTSGGRVLAWGDNQYGELGDGTTTGRHVPVRVRIPAGTTITAVRAGCAFGLALTSAGRVLAWGDNDLGELGNGTTTNSDIPVRVHVPKGTRVTGISAGGGFGLARTAQGKVLAWGDNVNGELGDGTTTNSSTPVLVHLPAGATATDIAAGAEHGLALTPAGMYAWGYNGFGQLGNGTTTNTDTPVRVEAFVRGHGFGHVTGLFGGCEHSLALFSSGTVLAWGYNEHGQLGNGTTNNSEKPAQVIFPAGTTVKAISAGCQDSFALTASGRVLAWGYNEYGTLGDGTTTASALPVRVALPSGWRASSVDAGPDALHALAIARKT
jgi:alpha-tubulin suppressor-like RCC1 family protein